MLMFNLKKKALAEMELKLENYVNSKTISCLIFFITN